MAGVIPYLDFVPVSQWLVSPLFIRDLGHLEGVPQPDQGQKGLPSPGKSSKPILQVHSSKLREFRMGFFLSPPMISKTSLESQTSCFLKAKIGWPTSCSENWKPQIRLPPRNLIQMAIFDRSHHFQTIGLGIHVSFILVFGDVSPFNFTSWQRREKKPFYPHSAPLGVDWVFFIQIVSHQKVNTHHFSNPALCKLQSPLHLKQNRSIMSY